MLAKQIKMTRGNQRIKRDLHEKAKFKKTKEHECGSGSMSAAEGG